MARGKWCIAVLLAFVALALPLLGEEITVGQIATGTKGVVAAAHPLAAKVGAEILARGGNAVDAAVATAFALGVVEPYASGIGGEGVMVISLADGTEVAIDYKSVAPGHVTLEGTDTSVKLGPKGTCVPGVVAGLALALEKYGTMSLAEVLEPAIRLAREGFPIDEVFVDVMAAHGFYENIVDDPEISSIFLKDGLIPDVGTVITNPELAHAYELIAQQGPEVFYEGEIAEAIVQATEGWITKEDLAQYTPREMEPVRGDYRGYEVLSAPPPVGGTTLIEALNILENFDLSGYSYTDPEAIHLIAESLLLASADRYRYVGDPAFFAVPIKGLTSDAYARERAELIRLDAVIPPREAPAGGPFQYEYLEEHAAIYSVPEEATSLSTTHVSVVDKEGNAVSLTQTLSYFWGSQVFVSGYGFFLNNELHNFNRYDPTDPTDLNEIAPYKRPRTLVAPTIVKRDGEIFLVVGTPGAGRIISTLLEVIVNVVDFGMDLKEAIAAPKFCSRVAYKELRMEEGYPEETLAALEALGHKIKLYSPLNLYFGGVNAVMVREDGTIIGVGSLRRQGAAGAVN